MIVQAKFYVQSATKFANGSGKGASAGANVVLNPVTKNDTPENKAFWETTPSGKIEMFISTPIADKFKPGDEILIDFHVPDEGQQEGI